MRIIYTKDTTINLCDTCLNIFPTCTQTILEFGNGPGNDNVIKCSEYNGKMLEGFEIGPIAPKLSSDAYLKAFIADINTGTEKE